MLVFSVFSALIKFYMPSKNGKNESILLNFEHFYESTCFMKVSFILYQYAKILHLKFCQTCYPGVLPWKACFFFRIIGHLAFQKKSTQNLGEFWKPKKNWLVPDFQIPLMFWGLMKKWKGDGEEDNIMVAYQHLLNLLKRVAFAVLVLT